MTGVIATELQEGEIERAMTFEKFGMFANNTEYLVVGLDYNKATKEDIEAAYSKGLLKTYDTYKEACEGLKRAQDIEKLLRPQWQLLVYAEQQARRYMHQQVLRVL